MIAAARAGTPCRRRGLRAEAARWGGCPGSPSARQPAASRNEAEEPGPTGLRSHATEPPGAGQSRRRDRATARLLPRRPDLPGPASLRTLRLPSFFDAAGRGAGRQREAGPATGAGVGRGVSGGRKSRMARGMTPPARGARGGTCLARAAGGWEAVRAVTARSPASRRRSTLAMRSWHSSRCARPVSSRLGPFSFSVASILRWMSRRCMRARLLASGGIEDRCAEAEQRTPTPTAAVRAPGSSSSLRCSRCRLRRMTSADGVASSTAPPAGRVQTESVRPRNTSATVSGLSSLSAFRALSWMRRQRAGSSSCRSATRWMPRTRSWTGILDAAEQPALVAPVHPAVGRQAAQQLRRELERLVGQDVLLQELQRLALLGGLAPARTDRGRWGRRCGRGGRTRRRRSWPPGRPRCRTAPAACRTPCRVRW